jgi:hypothetical protein
MRVSNNPSGLNTDTRLRLVRLLGMCGSDHDAEVVTAARMANRLVRDNGVTWHEVITAPVVPRLSNDDPLAQFTTRAAACMFTLSHAPMLTHWEVGFLRNLAGFDKLSPKQLATLRRLVARAIAAGGRP